MMPIRRVSTGLALVCCMLACSERQDDTDTPPVLPFASAHMRLVHAADTTRVLVELAESAEQHTLGLMERRHLADSAGMLFLYPGEQPASAGFWMFRTRIPLDIAFMDSSGAIRSIQHMVPCTTTLAEGCPSYPPGVPYRAALEVNGGYFARHALAVGDRLLLGDTATRIAGHAGR